MPNAAHCGSLAILAGSRNFRGGSISRAREFDSFLGFSKLQKLRYKKSEKIHNYRI